MLALLFLYLLLEPGFATDVELEVAHDSDDDSPTVFLFKCTVKDYDDYDRVGSISLYRQASSSGDYRNSPLEQVATITAINPNAPSSGVGFERVGLNGHIDFESDSDTYLEVVFQELTVEDLGLYICKAAVVGDDGDVAHFTAEAKVVGTGAGKPQVIGEAAPTEPLTIEETTTLVQEITAVADEETTAALKETTLSPEETTLPLEETTLAAVEETTLAAVQETTLAAVEETTTAAVEETTTLVAAVEETTLAAVEETRTLAAVEETTLAAVEETTTAAVEETTTLVAAVEETTLAAVEETRTLAAVEETTLAAVEETTTAAVEETTVVPEETTLAVEETTLAPDETTLPVEETTTDLAELVGAVETLDGKLEEFNESVVALEEKVVALEAKVDTVTQTTPAADVPAEGVNNYFVYENASYIFIKAEQDTDVNLAKTTCENKKFYLTEINSEGELQAISDEISPHIVEEAVVRVAGQKEVDTDVWLYQGSKEQIDFFAWGAGEPAHTADNGCLALRRTADGVDMVAVPCSSNNTNFYILCEHDD